MLGSIIGNYEVISQFGEGGMGELYIGRHIRLAREVIIKTIRTEDFSPRQVEHLRDRLEREAYIQSQLDHPNIVRVYDFIASGDMTCIVMEYVPGRDLRKMIARETGPVPADRSIKLFKQVLAAIDYAHHFIYSDKSGEKHQGIIHRDLKPANILVTPEDLVKVTDFGIVKVRGVKGGTQMGFNPGTPEYMSPEQALGRELDQRSDIYSMGIVFYELLTGHVPFGDDSSNTSDYEIRRGHIELPVPPLSKFYPGISPELEKIVLKSLEKNPDDRYQTARQFLDVIKIYERTGVAKIPGRLPGARHTIAHEGRGKGRPNLSEAPTIDIEDAPLTDPSEPQTSLEIYNNHPYENNASDIDGFRPNLQRSYRQDYQPDRSDQPVISLTPRSKIPLLMSTVVAVLLVIATIYWFVIRPSQPSNQRAIVEEMISIPGGEFKMGRDDGNDYERPAHLVEIKPFLIDKYEVTNQQYADFVRQTRRQPPKHWIDGNYFPGEANHPVVFVNWYEARDFCEWKGKRLPTEEEWEFAARGKENLLYPYGNEWKPQYSNARETNIATPQAVGSYPAGASPFGVLDMAGNAAEWTASRYRAYPGGVVKPNHGMMGVRGGAFNAPARDQRATDRFFYSPNDSNDHVGFRCAKDIN